MSGAREQHFSPYNHEGHECFHDVTAAWQAVQAYRDCRGVAETASAGSWSSGSRGCSS